MAIPPTVVLRLASPGGTPDQPHHTLGVGPAISPVQLPGGSNTQPRLGPLPRGPCHRTGLHLRVALAPRPSFLPLPSPCVSPRLRGGQTFGEPGREGVGCLCQADRPSTRQTPCSPSPHLPSPSIFRSITVHCWVYFFSHSFPRKTARVPPGKAISPSPELVRGRARCQIDMI